MQLSLVVTVAAVCFFYRGIFRALPIEGDFVLAAVATELEGDRFVFQPVDDDEHL